MGGVRWAGWVTGFAMVVLGALWMFMWLVGSNGFSSSRGGVILGGNLLLVVLAIPGAIWLARRLSSRWLADGWPQWKAVPLAVVGAFSAGLGFLCVSCFVVLAVASA
jgi:hypothetical protein